MTLANKCINKCLNTGHLLFCSSNGPPLQSTQLEINIFFLLLLKNFKKKTWFLSGTRGRDCRGATSLNPISDLVHWAHLVFFFPSSLHHAFYSLPPFIPLHPPNPFFSSLLDFLFSHFSPLSCFSLFLSLHKWVHFARGMRPRWLNQIGARLYLDCSKREREREKHQTAGWWLHGLFYISKLADSGFPGHTKLTILVILA